MYGHVPNANHSHSTRKHYQYLCAELPYVLRTDRYCTVHTNTSVLVAVKTVLQSHMYSVLQYSPSDPRPEFFFFGLLVWRLGSVALTSFTHRPQTDIILLASHNKDLLCSGHWPLGSHHHHTPSTCLPREQDAAVSSRRRLNHMEKIISVSLNERKGYFGSVGV